VSTRRLVAVTMSATYPPRRGNQIRTASLLASLGAGWEVESYSLTLQRTDLPLPRRVHPVSERWTDNRTRDPLVTTWTAVLGRLGKPPVFVERILGAWPHAPLLRALRRADVVMVSPPYHFGWVRRQTPSSVPVVFDEHSIEADLYADSSSWWARAIEREVERCERAAVQGADLVFVTSEDDGEAVRALGARRTALVPNGVDTERFAPATDARRHALRRELSLPSARVLAVFVGSGHPPNVEAVASIEREADAYLKLGIDVVIVGRCGIGRAPVSGVIHTGEVTDVVPYLQAADIALCPLLTGSGTSLKTLEYLSAGLPLVSTDVGIRGLGLTPGADVMISTPADMPAQVARLAAKPDERATLSAAGRALVTGRFSWAAIGRAAARTLDELAGSKEEQRRGSTPAEQQE
jgi:glycosyltransferase involved in cell wall biosynthesis